LLQNEDPTGEELVSVLAQDGVLALYSGAAAATASENGVVVEGVRGRGEDFMLGRAGPEPLPAEVAMAVRQLAQEAAKLLGAVKVEWVHDGKSPWVVQLHRGPFHSRGQTIYPGTPKREHSFAVERGLEPLRTLAERLRGTEDGIVLVGRVGLTSHFGDILRRARVPSRIDAAPSEFVAAPLFEG
jgi:hypothetical protein